MYFKDISTTVGVSKSGKLFKFTLFQMDGAAVCKEIWDKSG